MQHSKISSTEKLHKTFSKMKMANSFCNSGSPIRPQSQVKNFIIPQSNQIKESLLHKSMKLNIMIRSLHSFATSIEQLDWILLQSQKIIASFIKASGEVSTQSVKIQIENMHKELLKLIERFSGLNKREIKELSSKEQTQNQNTMNMKKTATTRSFKLMETEPYYENEEEVGEFEKINLPTIRQTAPEIINQRYENEQKIKQYESTIQILKQQIEREKQESKNGKKNLSHQIIELEAKLQQWQLNWKSYEAYAKGTIRKCKQYLSKITGDQGYGEKEDIENYLDELFCWQNKIVNHMQNSKMTQTKEQLASEVAELEFQVREKKNEIRKLQTYRYTHKQKGEEGNNLLGMLYAQATTIERLI